MLRTPFRLLGAIVVIAALGGSGLCRAASNDASAILAKADKAGLAKSSRMKVVQTIHTPSGDVREFKILSYSQGGNEKSLTEYVAPNQVRGMKILTLNDGDDIWSYFPRTNRTRKIASSARNRRVQGSDFTYDDMATGKLAAQWTGKMAGTETIEGHTCQKLLVAPTKKGPRSYKKAIMWIDSADYALRRIDYYDEDGDLQKRLVLGEYKKIGGVLVPHGYTMTNLSDGGRTTMKIVAAQVNVDLPEDLFSSASLGK